MIRKFILGCFVGATLVALTQNANAGVSVGGYTIKYGSVVCDADGTGGVSENRDYFQCAVTNAFANVLCVNKAFNNGNPYTASAQIADLVGDAKLSVSKDKKFWLASATVNTDEQINDGMCQNTNWSVVTWDPNDDGVMKPVYAITNMYVTLSVFSCNPKDADCLDPRVKATLPLNCTAPTGEPYLWDVNFVTVVLNGDGTASDWPGAPKAGEPFSCGPRE